MIIYIIQVVGISIHKTEYDTEICAHSDRLVLFHITAQLMQSISGNIHLLYRFGRIQ